MVDLPRPNELFRVARDEVLIRNPSLTREVVERPGSDANALTAAGVGIGDEVLSQLADVEAGLFLDSAKGTKLDRLVYDLCGQMKRNGATPGITDVYLTTTVPTVSGFSIPERSLIRTIDGITYYTKTAATFPSGSTGPVIIPAQSSLAGANQQVRKETLVNFVKVPDGAPTDLRVTNPEASAGADDVEDDTHFLARARMYPKTVEKATLDAILAGALGVPGVRTANVFESLNLNGTPSRLVDLVVADAFTEQLIDANTLPVAYQAQAIAFAQSVRTALQNVKACGIYISVRLGVVRLQGITLALKFMAGVDTVAVSVAAQAAAVAFVNSLAPGQSLQIAALNAAIRRVPGLYLTPNDSLVFSPVGDVEASPLEVIRTTLDLVSFGRSA